MSTNINEKFGQMYKTEFIGVNIQNQLINKKWNRGKTADNFNKTILSVVYVFKNNFLNKWIHVLLKFYPILSNNLKNFFKSNC